MCMNSRLLAVCLVVLGVGAAGAAELEILNVYDAFGSAPGTRQHFGFSAVVRYGETTILFDAGSDADIFAANLKALGVDPKEIDVAVASHNHADHISGFDYLLEVNPDVHLFLPHDFALGAPVPLGLAGRDPSAVEALPKEQLYFGGDFDGFTLITSGRFRGPNVEFVREPKEVAPGVHLVPTQSELLGTFSRYPPHGDDPTLSSMPELSVAIETEKGDVLLVGCSHASVEVILRGAMAQSGRPVRLLAGGYHLLPYDSEQITGLSKRLRTEHKVAQVAPAHCTGHLAFKLLRDAYGDDYRFFGLGQKLELGDAEPGR
jgi:7,8-dihydropterin-6-yl-methyl-4-(beta-D-ribofuranosyl)aminobenzene 5'-phosphate synthase